MLYPDAQYTNAYPEYDSRRSFENFLPKNESNAGVAGVATKQRTFSKTTVAPLLRKSATNQRTAPAGNSNEPKATSQTVGTTDLLIKRERQEKSNKEDEFISVTKDKKFKLYKFNTGSLKIQHTKMIHNISLKYLTESFDMLLLPNILNVTFVFGFVFVIIFTLHRIYKCHYDFTGALQAKTDVQKIRDNNLSLIREQSIIGHKKMFFILEYAASRCYDKEHALKCIEIVLYCPFLINTRSTLSSLTPFHHVCYHGHSCLISFMLRKGADPFLATKTGENALCMAIRHFLDNPIKSDFSCLEILLETGCQAGLKNKWYNLYLKAALANNHSKLAQWLLLHFRVPSNKNTRCSSLPPTILSN